jgi:hypothetical protein
MTNTNTDAILACKDCGRDFLLTASTRQWYETKDLTLPRRCENCRRVRRAGKRPQAMTTHIPTTPMREDESSARVAGREHN